MSDSPSGFHREVPFREVNLRGIRHAAALGRFVVSPSPFLAGCWLGVAVDGCIIRLLLVVDRDGLFTSCSDCRVKKKLKT